VTSVGSARDWEYPSAGLFALKSIQLTESEADNGPFEKSAAGRCNEFRHVGNRVNPDHPSGMVTDGDNDRLSRGNAYATIWDQSQR
jgi:hypothetical protein